MKGRNGLYPTCPLREPIGWAAEPDRALQPDAPERPLLPGAVASPLDGLERPAYNLGRLSEGACLVEGRVEPIGRGRIRGITQRQGRPAPITGLRKCAAAQGGGDVMTSSLWVSRTGVSKRTRRPDKAEVSPPEGAGSSTRCSCADTAS